MRDVAHFANGIKPGTAGQPVGKVAAETDPQRRPTCFSIGTVPMPAFRRQHDQRSFLGGVSPALELDGAATLLEHDKLPFVECASLVPVEEVFVWMDGRREYIARFGRAVPCARCIQTP